MSSNTNVLMESITCSITGVVMTDPVQGIDGHTYERSAIEEWLRRNPISPQTRQPMNISDLTTNTSIRFLCDKYHEGNFGNISPPQIQPIISSNHIKLLHKKSFNKENNYLLLSFNVDSESFPKEVEHLSQDIVLVIDRSGSMGTTVEAKDAEGNSLEKSGFSIQDIVNHAVKTITKTLDVNSRLAIIAFDNNIEVFYELNLMTDINKTTILGNINKITPRGQTNIYGALEKAIQILDIREDKSRNSAILILTDGMPTQVLEPAYGTVKTLQKLRIKKNFTAPIYTFGFGYNLQDELLYDIAKYANGGNAHIPDGGMIATVFCNFIATILCTVVMNLQLHIITPGVSLMGDYAYNLNKENKTIIYDLGTVQYQQSRDIIIKTNNVKNIEYYFTYKIGGNSYKSRHFKENLSTLVSDIDDSWTYPYSLDEYITNNFYRYDLIENIHCMINYARCQDFDNATLLFNNMEKKLKSVKSNSFIDGMITNLSGSGFQDGQIKLAITNPTYFKRWGKFYLDQLTRSLNQQIKPNFKDSACIFGGDIFNEIVDKSSDIFNSLPPPTPSNSSSQSGSSHQYRGLSARSAPPPNLAAFNDPRGGCYTEDSQILMANLTKKQVKDIKKGDEIMTLSDPYNIKSITKKAKVLCVVKTKYSNPVKLVDFGVGLKITEWHPILSPYDNMWIFPCSAVKDSISTEIEYLYTLVLDNYHVAFVDDIPCICLGHNFNEGILKHSYFGTRQVIDDLKKLDGWNEGLVIVDSEKYTRCEETNLINRLKN